MKTLTHRQKDEAARNHFDLSGEWPVVRGKEWDEGRGFDLDVWNTLTPDERSRLQAWAIANDREFRETYFHGGNAMAHYPINDEIEVIDSPDSRVSLYFSSGSIRHAEHFTVCVDNTRDLTEAEAMFREWLEDISRLYAAKAETAPRLTA